MYIIINLKNKQILFIATKNKSYIRNVQEIKLLKAQNSVTEICYENKSYFVRLIRVYIKLLFINKQKYDVIFIGFAPQLILPIFKKLLKNKQIYIDFFISLYDTFVNDRKRFKSRSVVAKFLYVLDKKTLKQASKVICDTKAHQNYFIKFFNIKDRQKFEVIYLEANKQIYYPMHVPKLEYLKDKFVVLYFGSILPIQGIDIILDTCSMFNNNKNIGFFVIGPIDDELKNKYKNLSNTTFISWLKEEELAKYIAMSDLCLSGHFNDNINKAKRVIAGKSYIYDAMEKPMILGDNRANRELYKEDNKKYYYVKMGSSKLLYDKILDIYNNFN